MQLIQYQRIYIFNKSVRHIVHPENFDFSVTYTYFAIDMNHNYKLKSL